MLEAFERALDGAHGGRALDEISATVWRAAGDGVIADDDAHTLLERIAERRAAGAATKAETAPRRTSTVFPPRRPQRPPDRAEAIERRRAVAASGALPPRVAKKFTNGEQAVMAVIVGQVRCSTKTGDCRLPIDAIAAMAAVSRSTVKRALHTAVRIGLVRVTERPQKGRKNLPNLIEVIDRAVMGWIRRGPQRPISADRGSSAASHEYKSKKKGPAAGVTEPPKPDFRRSRRRRR